MCGFFKYKCLQNSLVAYNIRVPNFSYMRKVFAKNCSRPVVPTAERRSPKPNVGGSNPSWPAIFFRLRCITELSVDSRSLSKAQNAGSNPAYVKIEASQMSAKSDTQANRFDTPKWLVVVALIALGVVGNSVYSDQSLLFRVLGLVAVAVVAGLVAAQTVKGKSFLIMFKEARNEIRKVVWPNRQETMQTTLIVIAVVLVMALLLWGLDSLLSWIVSSIIG